MRRLVWGLAIALFAAAPAWAAATDQEVAQQIADSLRNSGKLMGYSIAVKFKEGTARLDGTVRSREQMDQAMAIVNSLPAVGRVVNNLSVAPEATVRPAAPQPDLRAEAPGQPRGFVSQPNSLPLAGMPTPAPAPGAASEQVVNAGGQPLPARPAQPHPEPNSALMPAHYAGGQGPQLVSPGEPASPAAALPPPAVAQVPQEHRPEVRSLLSGQQVSGQPAPLAAQPVGQAMQAAPYYHPGVQQAPYYAPVGAPRAASPLIRPQFASMPQRTAYPAPVAHPPMVGHPPGVGYGAAGLPVPATLGGPLPEQGAYTGAGTAPAVYDQPYLPNYAWPSYAAYPNYAALTYPKQYAPTAWPYIGPFYPYPQVPLGWRKVTLEWDDGWWFLNFADDRRHAGHF